MKSEVFNTDCLEAMKAYPDNYFELAIVDPPYGININVSMGRRRGDKKSNYHKFAGNDSEIPNEEYFIELFRVSKNQIIWGGNYMTDFLRPSSCWLLWDKGFSQEVTFAQFEMAWTSFNTNAKKYDKHPNQLNRIHPTQKPVALYRWLLKNYAKEGYKILDTHLGSGSSRIAADMECYDFTGFELDKDYFDASCKRFNEYKMQTKLF
ncbi:DNA methyltransferase [Runella sp.]|uniref:DNA methyltransferase n=1 Tax=Runella sp. TaxID=1960881 RepID=UPI00301780B9